jgi:hypothetical protein
VREGFFERHAFVLEKMPKRSTDHKAAVGQLLEQGAQREIGLLVRWARERDWFLRALAGGAASGGKALRSSMRKRWPRSSGTAFHVYGKAAQGGIGNTPAGFLI